MFFERHEPPLTKGEVLEQFKNRLKYQNGYPALFQRIEDASAFYEWSADNSAMHINLKGHSCSELPGYQQAKDSAEANFYNVLATRYPRNFTILPGKSEKARRENFFSWLGFDTLALSVPSHIELMQQAARAGDEGFFLRMSEVMKSRHARKWPTSPQVAMTFHWAKCLMWLMTDSVGWTYLRDHVYRLHPSVYKVTLDSYTKTRQRLKLHQHPKPPIIGITADGELLGLDKLLSKLSSVKR
ncbi:MAG: hypothetical protein INR62_00885 [Rhodospirillales bacterium]|nr:hypothetical protein [Acetobacter sp.]